MAAVRGKDFKLYRDTEANDPYGYWASPSWSLINNVKDVTRGLEKAMADASVRGSSFRQKVGTLKDLSLDFQMVYDQTDPDLAAFEVAFYDDTNIPMASLDGPIGTVGSAGIRFIAQVAKFEQDEALENVGLVNISLVPGYDPENLPTRVIVDTPGTLTVVSS